jgi:hypothetical protein
MAEDDTPSSEVFTPKKSNLSRQAIAQNAIRRSLASSGVPVRQPDNRPSYSAAHLSELKTSTPSTPKELLSQSDAELSASQSLDIASKFGSYTTSLNPAIPTDSEIQEKKARRARLAKEQKYNIRNSSSPNSSDEDLRNGDADRDSDEDEFRQNNNTVSILPARSKQPESRLVADDEDIMEDFDNFVEDGGITLGRKAEREQKARKKAEIADLIREAERSSDEASSDSDLERRAEYEYTQTRKGMDGMRVDEHNWGGSDPNWGGGESHTVAWKPPRITPLPNLGMCLHKLRGKLRAVEASRMAKVKELEDCERERRDVRDREVEIQVLLKEVGARYERLRAEAGLPLEEEGKENGVALERGLESLGGTPGLLTPAPATPAPGSLDQDSDGGEESYSPS